MTESEEKAKSAIKKVLRGSKYAKSLTKIYEELGSKFLPETLLRGLDQLRAEKQVVPCDSGYLFSGVGEELNEDHEEGAPMLFGQLLDKLEELRTERADLNKENEVVILLPPATIYAHVTQVEVDDDGDLCITIDRRDHE